MRNIINAGELNDELLIQRATGGGYDDSGFPIPEEIVTIADVYCKVKTVSTKEYIAADKESSALVFKFIVLSEEVPDEIVTEGNDMYIVYNDKQWDIKHVAFIGDYHYEITAELRK